MRNKFRFIYASLVVFVLFTGALLPAGATAYAATLGPAPVMPQQDDDAETDTTEPVTSTRSITASTGISGPAAITGTAPVTVSTPLTGAAAITDTETVTGTPAITSTGSITDSAAELDAAYAEVVEGTIVANRTAADVRFFVEGETFMLDPQRSLGLDLPRVTAVLNLYNCDANTPETEIECYWDPYLLNRSGFYEVVAGADEGLAVNLTLREAGAPPADQVWIQNRTGKREIVVYRSVTYELAPSTVQEFSVVDDALPTFFLRSCVVLDEQSACEWAPVVVEPGFYYSLEEQTTAGGLPGSDITELIIEPVVAEAGEVAIEAVAESTPPQIRCSLLVPALNVRSGPGLEYQIVAKVRGSEEEPATVIVVGQNDSGEWLAVTERLADGGWITGSTSYIACEGDLASLPIAEITDGRLEPTPVPVAQPADTEVQADAAANAGGEGSGVAATETSTGTADTNPAVPEGLAVIQVRNDFEQPMRFTIDQRFRPESGPSEYDLEPGQSASFVVWPGPVAFSASTPWRGLSGNADTLMESNQLRDLKLTFVPDPDGSDRWDLLVWE
jgi:hypothetical protein